MYSAVKCALVDGINSINLYKYGEGIIFVRNDDSFDVLGFVQNQTSNLIVGWISATSYSGSDLKS